MSYDSSVSASVRCSGVYEDATLYPGYTVVLVIGAAGLVLLEAKIKTALLTGKLRKQIRRWLRANDTTPPLRIVR